jgi:histone H3/H4
MVESTAKPPWRHCSVCKAAIACGSTYLICSVSTCNRVRTGLVFCKLDCWDAHVPGAGHRDASAEELTAPATPDGAAEKPGSDDRKPGKRVIAPTKLRDPSLPKDVLVISKPLKEYIRAASDLRTSDTVVEVLSEKLRDMCDRAIERAKAEGRKTVLDRDFLPK